MARNCDVLIIGAGPAGLSAGIYASRAKLSTIILDKGNPGGQIGMTNEVANYPGSPNDTGPGLIDKMVGQCKDFGVEFIREGVTEVNLDGDVKIIKTADNEYHAKSVIIATGAKPRKIGCPGESKLVGYGVSYCATCDAEFFTDLEVFVIGGGTSAVEEGHFITKFARKVTILYRGDKLRADKTAQEKAFNNPKMEIIYNTEVKEIKGDGMVESMVLVNNKTGEETEYFAHEEDGTFGIFPFIGYIPNTSVFEGMLEAEYGYLVTDPDMKTNIEGVFAAGDVRVKSLRQVVTATADGAIAAVQAEKYIEHKFN